MHFSPVDIQSIVDAFKLYTNVDFSDYAERSFHRRIEHLMMYYSIGNAEELISNLKNKPNLRIQYLNEITVNTTEFFRDLDVWIFLKDLIKKQFKDVSKINAWHAGCSSGEEVYSLILLLKEVNLFHKSYITATDINTQMVERASNGFFQSRYQPAYFINYDKFYNLCNLDFEQKTKLYYSKHFEIDTKKTTIHAKNEFLTNVKFETNNIIEKPVYFNMDIVFCRNVLIYFNLDLQLKVLYYLYESLAPKGLLILGPQENINYIGQLGKMFKMIDDKCIFEKI